MSDKVIHINTPPQGDGEVRQFSMIDFIMFAVGAGAMLWGAFKTYDDLYKAHFPNEVIWQTLVVKVVVGGFLFPAIFPANPYHTWARRVLGDIIGMTNMQWIVGMIVAFTYNVLDGAGRQALNIYEGIDLVQAWQLSTINLLGTFILPGLLMVRMPDWQARRAAIEAQEIARAQLLLDEQRFELDSKKEILAQLKDNLRTNVPDRLFAASVWLIDRLLPPSKPAQTSSDDSSKLLTRLLLPDSQHDRDRRDRD